MLLAEIAKVNVHDAIEDVSYNAATTVLTIAYKGDTVDKTINLPKENFLSAASFYAITNVLTLALVDGTKVPINFYEFVDTYTIDDMATIDMNLANDGTITANVKV